MGKIYKRETLSVKAENLEQRCGKRKRNVILNFRVTEIERDLINQRIEMSGLKKEDYLIESLLYQKILVRGNIKTFDKFRKNIEKISSDIKFGKNISDLEPLQIESLRIILEILKKLFG